MDEENCIFHILLPFCIESKFDVFLTILKVAVARSSFKRNDLICAFMHAMEGGKFFLKMEDLTQNWKARESHTQKKRQMKLLGFWAIANFPSLGKKLLGQAFQVPQRNGVSFIGSTQVEAENIDKVVFAKLRLRVIELTVSASTYDKLKNFVKVPVVVGANRNDEKRVTPQMVSFDVDQDFVQNCWEALKSGEYTMNSDIEQPHTVMYPCVTTVMDEVQNCPIENEREMPLPKRVCRRPCNEGSSTDDIENTDDVTTIDSRISSPLDVLCHQRFSCHGRSTQTDNTINGVQAETGTNNDSLRAIVLQIQEEVGTISKTIQDHGSEEHVTIINQKDDEIARLNESCNELKNNNERLLSSHTSLVNEIEVYRSTIASLKKEIDAKTGLNEKLKADMADSAESNAQLKTEADLLSRQLAEAETEIASKKKASDQLLSLKAKSDLIAAELSKEKAVSLESNARFTAETECLIRKLAEAEKVIEVNEKMNQELLSLKTKGKSITAELASEIKYLEEINSESVEQNGKLQQELSLLKKHGDRSKDDVATQTCDDENFGKSSMETAAEVKSSDDILTEYIGGDENGLSTERESNDDNPTQCIDRDDELSKAESECDDPVVKACRSKLLKLKYGWMKFVNKKKAKFSPGFTYPPDKDGICRAQKITSTGYPTNKKFEYYEFNENLPAAEKKSSEKSALNKFNIKFRLNMK